MKNSYQIFLQGIQDLGGGVLVERKIRLYHKGRVVVQATNAKEAKRSFFESGIANIIKELVDNINLTNVKFSARKVANSTPINFPITNQLHYGGNN